MEVKILDDLEFNSLDLKEKLKYIRELNEKKVLVEDLLKQINIEISRREFSVSNQMLESGIEKIKVEGLEFKLKEEKTFSLSPDFDFQRWDNEEFFKWLKSIGKEDYIKVIETVPPSTRNKLLRELSERDDIQFPDWIIKKQYTTVSYNKSQIKREVLGE